MNKTRTYGLIGLLLAVMLVATIYSFGASPNLPPPSPNVSLTPGNSPFPSLSPLPSNSPEPQGTPMKTFASYDELKTFLNQSNSQSVYGYVTDSRNSLGPVPGTFNGAVPTSAPTASLNTETKGFSTTNIQVAGVDEADTVKTDGKYLYVIGNNSQVVYIMDANPQNAKVLAKIYLNNTSLLGIYLSQDGNKLAVIGNQYVPYFYDTKLGFASATVMPYWNSGTNFVMVYDVSNKANPVLSRNFTMSGYYVNSRMIGNYVYDIVTETAYLSANGSVILPTVFSGLSAYSVEPTKIYYANSSDTSYSYTTILAMNIMDKAAQPTNMTIMMGGAGTIYVSQSNIYVTYPVMDYKTVPAPTPMPPVTATPSMPVDSGKNGSNIPSIGFAPMPIMWMPTWQGTAIYRIHISGASLTFAAQGNVTGNVLNQYSMDENNGYLRIATTSYDYNSTNWWSGVQQNNLYVLNSDLKVVGKIENIATGENLHSARFMGTRCYMVTFMKTDPLFVIDLTQPTNPKILGNLTIPGYSDFLQPYDATHLIGIGKDAIADENTDFAWYQGMKLSLFDVTNVNAPREIAKTLIGDRGTNSEALYDPKAILFDQSKNLLVLPVDLYLINKTAIATPLPTKLGVNASAPNTMPIAPPFIGRSGASEYGMFAWQGVYIYDVTISGGFVLKGNVTQMDNAAALLNDPSLAMMSSYQWINYNQFITRSLYIDNVLYTFSQTRVQLNSLDNFALLAKIELN